MRLSPILHPTRPLVVHITRLSPKLGLPRTMRQRGGYQCIHGLRHLTCAACTPASERERRATGALADEEAAA